MHRVNVSLLCLCSLSLAGPAFGQTSGNPQTETSGVVAYQSDPTPVVSSEPSGVTNFNSLSGGATFGAGTYMNIRYMSGNGVGYQNGYGQIGGFMPIWIGENSFLAPDTRLLVTNNTQVGANLGAVGRTYVDSWDRIFGAYGYFDLDQSNANYNYTQGTFGVETLGRYWDIRANGYFPTHRQDNAVSNGAPLCLSSASPTFMGNNLVFSGVAAQTREQAATGFDAEFGIPVFPSTPWLRAYAGVYAYNVSQVQAPPVTMATVPNQTSANPVGFRGRIDAWISDDLLVGANVTTDRVWGTNVNAVVDFRFSGFRPTRYFPQWSVRERMLQPVQRNWRIAVERYGTAYNTPVPGINPNTGNPYFIDFVDNSAPAGGNGTFEHPFNSLNAMNAANNPGVQIILVENNNGQSITSNPSGWYTGSLSLFPGQKLFGEGSNAGVFPVTAQFGAACSAVNQNVSLPGYTGGGPYPFVTGPGANGTIISLSSNNEVAGFNFYNFSNSAIAGNNITNFYLHEIQATQGTNPLAPAISLTNVSSAPTSDYLNQGIAAGTPTTIISMINQGSPNYPNASGLGDNQGGGIFVSTGAGGVSNLVLSKINMNNDGSVPQPYGIQLVANNGSLNTTLTNVSTSGTGSQNGNGQAGVILSENGQSLTATFGSTTAPGLISSNNVGDGLQVSGTGGSVNLMTAGSSPVTANSNGGDGIRDTQVGGAGTFTLTNVTANSNLMDGVGLYASGGGTIGTVSNNALITNGTFDLNSHDGIFTDATGGGQIYLTVDPTMIVNNGANGAQANVSGTNSIVNLTFDATTITSNVPGANGFSFYDYNGTLPGVTSGGQLTATFQNGTTLANNANHAVTGLVDGTGATAGATQATILLTGTNASGSGSDNINLTDQSGGTLIFTASGANLSHSLAGNGINVLVKDTGAVASTIMDITLTNNTNVGSSSSDGNFLAGFSGTVVQGTATAPGSGAQLYSNLEGSSFSYNGTNGINIEATGTGAVAYYGVGAYSTNGGASLNAGAPDTVSHNGLDGVYAAALADAGQGTTTGGQINFRSGESVFDFNGTKLVANFDNGVNFLAGSGGTINTLFYGGEASHNGSIAGLTGDGVSITAPTGSLNNVTVSLQDGFAANFNGAYGLYINVGAANSFAFINDAANPATFTGNGIGPESVTVTGTAQVIEQILGTPQASYNFSGDTTAFVSFNGLINGNPSTISDGLSINMTGVQFWSVLIENYSAINNPSGDGIDIFNTGVSPAIPSPPALAGIEIDGVIPGAGPTTPGGTTMNVKDQAVNIQLNNVNLINNVGNAVPGLAQALSISVNTTQDPSAPQPIGLGSLGSVTPADGLNINHLSITGTNTTTGGINVQGTDSSLLSTAAQQSQIAYNVITNEGSGGAINVAMTASGTGTAPVAVDGLSVNGNVIGGAGAGNTGGGINVTVNNSAFGSAVTGSIADGNSITNNTVTNNIGDGIAFTVLNPTGSTGTGGLQITGNTVSNNTTDGVNSNGITTGNGIDLFLQNLNMSQLNISGSSSAQQLVTNNAEDGVLVTGSGLSVTSFSAAYDTITGNMGTAGYGNGLAINLSNGSNVMGSATANMSDIFSTNNANGLFINMAGASSLTGVAFQSGFIQDNNGDGVNATVAGKSTVSLTFTSETIGNSSGVSPQQNGVNYTIANTGGTFNATFANGTITDNAVNGIFGTINGDGTLGDSSSTIILNAAETVTGNIGSGVLISANNFGTLGLTVGDSNPGTAITNNHGNGVTLNLDSDARGTLNVTNATIGNVAAGGPQQDGIALNLNQTAVGSGKANLLATISNSTLSNNAVNGIAGQITGSVSQPTTNLQSGAGNGVSGLNGAHITLNDVTITKNVQDGLFFNVNGNPTTAGGILELTTTNSAATATGNQITGNGANGLQINAADASTLVAVSLTDTALDTNGKTLSGDGLNIAASAGATVNVEANLGTASLNDFSSNTGTAIQNGNGIGVTATGAGTRVDVDLFKATLTKNTAVAGATSGAVGNGLYFSAQNGADVNVRAYDTTFNTNGYAGLSGNVTQSATSTNTMGIVNIIGGTGNGNGTQAASTQYGSGYYFTTNVTNTNAATMTAQFQPDQTTPTNVPVQAENDGGYGIYFSASGPPNNMLSGNLLMSGNTTFSGNTLGNVDAIMSGMNQAVIQLSGTFNGVTNGDGVDASMSNISGVGLIAIQGGGTGTVNDNGGDGIKVTMTDVHDGGVYIGGFTSVSGNGVKMGAGGLGQDGINVTMTDVGGYLTTSPANQGYGALTIDGTPVSPSTTNMVVSNNSGNGVSVNINSDNHGGSYIENSQFVATSSTVTEVLYNPALPLGYVNGPPSPANPNPPIPASLPNPLLILVNPTVGSVVPFSANMAIQNLTLDSNGNATGGNLAGSGILVTVDSPANASYSSTIVDTVHIDNNTITNTGSTSTTDTHDGIQVQLLGGDLASGFNISNNFIGVTSTGTIGGNNGNGINFIGGGALTAGTPGVGTGFTGLQTLTIQDNTIENNMVVNGTVGTTGGTTGNGIDLQLNDAPTLATVNIFGNTITKNVADGFQMLNPNADTYVGQPGPAQAPMTLTFENNLISANGTNGLSTPESPGGMGIDILLSNNYFAADNATLISQNTAPVNNSITINVWAEANGGNTISGNASYGMLVQAINQSVYTVNVTRDPATTAANAVPNVFKNNVNAGLAIEAGSYSLSNGTLIGTAFTIGNIQIDDVQVYGNLVGTSTNFSGDGVAILTQGYAEINSLVIGDPTARDTTFGLSTSKNAGDGLHILADDFSEFREVQRDVNGSGNYYDTTTYITPLGQATMQLQNINAQYNTMNGIEIDHQVGTVLSWDDPAVNPAAALVYPTVPTSWQQITGGVDDNYVLTPNSAAQAQPGQAFNSYVYSNASTVDGSFIHMNNIIAANNLQNGLFVSTTNQQFPITRIDIVNTDPTGMGFAGDSRTYTTTNGMSNFNNNGANGMLFTSTFDSILQLNVQDTSASFNTNDGILVTTAQSATFGDVLPASPVGDPTSPQAVPSTFNGVTLMENGNATTQAAGGGNGLEIQANGQNGDQNNSSYNSVIAISMTTSKNPVNSVTNSNLIDSNAGNGVKLTAKDFSTTSVSMNAMTIAASQLNTGLLPGTLGGDGLDFIGHDNSASTFSLYDSVVGSIGTGVNNGHARGMTANGVEVLTDGNSTMTMLIGNPNSNGHPNAPSPDVTIAANQGSGILVQNAGSSAFFGETYNTVSENNADRGYSALEAQNSFSINDINDSSFFHNSREGIGIVANSELQSGSYLEVEQGPTVFLQQYPVNSFLNLSSATISTLSLTNSTVSDNGDANSMWPGAGNQTSVNGLEIDVSTYSYVAANIQDNTFHGNGVSDLGTASFTASTGSGGEFGGFNKDGSINNANQLLTPLSVIGNLNIPPTYNKITLEDTAQLDMRFTGNVGDQINPDSGAGNNTNVTHADGAHMTDTSNAKPAGPTAIFQVNGYNYDTISNATNGAGVATVQGTNVLPLDGAPVTPLPAPDQAGNFGTKAFIEGAIVAQKNYYYNANIPAANILTNQVQVQDLTSGAVGYVTGYTAGGQFSLGNVTGTFSAGDEYRVTLLNTNYFSEFNHIQDIQGAFSNITPTSGFNAPGAGYAGVAVNDFLFNYPTTGSLLPGPIEPPGPFVTTNPLAPYFDFPSASFPPN